MHYMFVCTCVCLCERGEESVSKDERGRELRRWFSRLLCIFFQSWGNLTISVRHSDYPTNGTGISGLMRCFHSPRLLQWKPAPYSWSSSFPQGRAKIMSYLTRPFTAFLSYYSWLVCLSQTDLYFTFLIELLWYRLKALSLITCQLQWRPT